MGDNIKRLEYFAFADHSLTFCCIRLPKMLDYIGRASFISLTLWKLCFFHRQPKAFTFCRMILLILPLRLTTRGDWYWHHKKIIYYAEIHQIAKAVGVGHREIGLVASLSLLPRNFIKWVIHYFDVAFTTVTALSSPENSWLPRWKCHRFIQRYCLTLMVWFHFTYCRWFLILQPIPLLIFYEYG